MKTFGIKSKIYKNKKVQFGPFVFNFDAEGFAEATVEEGKESLLAQTVDTYKDFICFIEEESNIALQKQKEKDIQYLNKMIEEKDAEIKSLKIANKELSSQIVALQAQAKAYKEQLAEKNTFNEAENVAMKTAKVNNDNTSFDSEEVKKEEEVFTEQELKNKTIPQLQDILNSVFKDYKNEWQSLKKKDDMIIYITQKIKD